MKNINIIKYNNNKIIEKKNISNVGDMLDENKEIINRLCDMLSMFIPPGDNGDLKSMINEIQSFDTIIIEMYKE